MTVRPSRGRSYPRPRNAATSDSEMPLTHSSVRTSFAVRVQSIAGTWKSGSSATFSPNSLAAAASMRKSISIVTERASVSTTSTSLRRLASGAHRSAWRAAK